MNLTVIQSGTCAQDGRESGTCLLLDDGKDSVTDAGLVLVDVGPGSLDRLAARAVDLGRVTALCLTHFHPDHCAEFASLVQTLVYGLSEPHSTGRLVVVGGPGLGAFIQDLARWQGDWLLGRPGRLSLQVEELQPGKSCTIPGPEGPLVLQAGAVSHSASSIAYRFDVGDGLVVTGDTGPNEELVGFARGAGYLVTECSFPDDQPVAGHMTPSAVADLARRVGVGHLVVGHFYPALDRSVALARIAESFHGRVSTADPGLVVAL